jgi:hypothetical protein
VIGLKLGAEQTPTSLAPAIRRKIWDVDPEAVIPVIKPLDTQMHADGGVSCA